MLWNHSEVRSWHLDPVYSRYLAFKICWERISIFKGGHKSSLIHVAGPYTPGVRTPEHRCDPLRNGPTENIWISPPPVVRNQSQPRLLGNRARKQGWLYMTHQVELIRNQKRLKNNSVNERGKGLSCTEHVKKAVSMLILVLPTQSQLPLCHLMEALHGVLRSYIIWVLACCCVTQA